MNTTFDFRLVHPDGPLSQHIQAVWSASVSAHSSSVSKPLFSDGACGAFIILKGDVTNHGQIYKQGLHWVPVKKQAQFISMSTGTEMVGFRFQPGIAQDSFSIFQDEEFDQIKLIKRLALTNQTDRLAVLSGWLEQHLQQDDSHNVLADFFQLIDHNTELQAIEKYIPLSLRQIERKFKSKVGMTPKYYQRLMRIRAAINRIRHNPAISLAELAMEVGYADQAHMNREFRSLAKMTPKEYQVSKQ